MLILSRREGESCIIGTNIIVTIVRSKNGNVKLGFTAPPNVEIDRTEVRQSKQREGRRPLNLFAGYPHSHGTLTTE